MSSYIRSISYYLPEKVLTNNGLCSAFPHLQADEIFRLTGIRERHIASQGQISSDLAFESAEALFREHSIDRGDIDFLLFCSEGLDHKAPATACLLQHRLKLSQTCGAVDIPLGCTGFVYGLSLAKALVESGQARNVLLLTSDTPSKAIHPNDHELRLIFGDAGAATLICAGGPGSIGDFVFGTDGSGAQNLIVRESGLRYPITKEWLEKYENVGGLPFGRMEMKGEEIFIFALKVVPSMVKELLEKAGLTMDDIDLFVFHQANGYLLEILRKKLKIVREKFIVQMESSGNTVSASIPIALHEAIKSGKAKKGDKVLIAGFGIGYSWAGTIITI